MTEALVNLDNAQTDTYREVLQGILERGECPFCEGNLEKTHKNPVLYQIGGWVITKNSYSYQEAEMAFLILNPSKHMEFLTDLSPADLLMIKDLEIWAINEYGIQGGGVAMRFGDPQWTGATVRHLHAHLIVPKIGTDGKPIPVYFPIG